MPRVLTDAAPSARVSPARADLETIARAFGHDLREQLGMLSMHNELLRHRAAGSLSPDAVRLLERSAAAVTRARLLVAELVAFLRLSPPEAVHVPASSESALDRALKTLAPALEAHGASVVREPLPPVLASADHLQQIFERLLDNAIKFRGAEPLRIIISSRRHDRMAVFQLGDNGRGFDPVYAEKVFQPLARLHGHTFEGTGMGLTVCRRIAQLYGGASWLESSAGGGTRVFFTLPLPEPEVS